MPRILFLHPDLGIGGAERLVVDAALALKRRGHAVSFLTNHHDPMHCFPETKDGSLDVCVVGDWLPRKLFGRFYAFCAYIRMLYAAFYASFCLSWREQIDIIFCDQISVGIPVLRLAKSSPKIIFYCHFPDQLLSTREGRLKMVYRAPLDYLEELAISMSDKTLVNSKFTLGVFQKTFRRLDFVPDVLYPSLNTDYIDCIRVKMQSQFDNSAALPGNVPRDCFIFLDINRYERKKDHANALHAFEQLMNMAPTNQQLAPILKRCRLIVAGGYDTRVVENVEHFAELEQLVKNLALEDRVVLLRSPSDEAKFTLLDAAQCLVYTPANEHFGIVPLEAMYMSKPVIALNSGGPTETVVDKATGFLCQPGPTAMCNAMQMLLESDALRERMGAMGRKRVQQKFSFDAFASKLDSIVSELLFSEPARLSEAGAVKKHN